MKTKINTKKITNYVMLVMLFLGVANINAQDKFGSDPETCKTNLSLFDSSIKSGDFEGALKPWKSVYKNCPKSSILIYSGGLKIANNQLKNGDANAKSLINEIYTNRIKYFSKNLGKVYNDWATFLKKSGATEDEIFTKLELAYNESPADMSGKNIKSYFYNIIDKYKDTNPQKVFNVYDDVLEIYNTKIKSYTTRYTKLQNKINQGETLTPKEQKSKDKKLFETNLGIYGRDLLRFDQKIKSLATCERLIPLYQKNYDANKTNIVWLKRTANRLNKKGCKEDPFFVRLIENWSAVEPSLTVDKYLESIYRRTGRTSEADALASKIFNQASPEEKAKFYYSQAQDLKNAGKYPEARTKAREVLNHQPSFGKAYILIARMYEKSADRCATKAFDKRMVFVAAAAKVRKAIRVDPSLAGYGNQLLKSYKGNFPTKTDVFNLGKTSGASHRVGCWIGESVRIP